MRLFNLVIIILLALLALVDPAFAQAEAQPIADAPFLDAQGMAILGIAIAAVGGAMGQSKAMSTALESIGRNPGAAGQMFLPWLLALVFIESLVIYALVIALKLVGII